MNHLCAISSRAALALLCLTGPGGCGGGPDTTSLNRDPRCQPLSVPSSGVDPQAGCALPFPSSYYLVADASTATGVRLHFPTGALPKNYGGEDFDVTRLNRLDGFSPATQIVADLGVRLDPAPLPPVDGDPARSMTASSAVQVLAYDTGERVPLFAELDQNAVQPGVDSTAEQALLIHPLVRLRASTRYVVALRGLVDRGGQPVVMPAFQALVSGQVSDGTPLGSLQPAAEEVFTFLEQHDVPRGELTLAWDFRTGSDTHIQGNLLAMRDEALRRWERQGLGVTITKVDSAPSDPLVLRQIEGTFSVPSFLTDPQSVSAGMMLDAAGQPVDSGANFEANLLILVPQCAAGATKALRTVVYGHGLLGAADEIASSLHRRISNQLCAIEMATNFVGLSEDDVPILANKVFARFDQFSITTDRLQQAMVNFVVLAHVAKQTLPSLPALSSDGTPKGMPLIDPAQVYYLGGSQGGIFGNTILSLSPDLDHGVLNVGGGNYSLMLARSVDFVEWKKVMDGSYPDLLAQQLLLALSQSYWDFTDPISFARNNLHDPLPGVDGQPMAPKQVLLQEARNDSQVPNVATRTVARTMGLPQLKPAVEAVFGLTQAAGPVDSAYVQYDDMAMPAPSKTNVPSGDDNGAHGSLGNLPAVVQQIDQFLRPGGRVVNTCGAACVFPFPN